MKRNIVTLFLLILALSTNGQGTFRYIYNNKNIVLNIYSNNKYTLLSTWWWNDIETDSHTLNNDGKNGTIDWGNKNKHEGIINWSEGYLKNYNDTIICIDSKSHKKIYLLKAQGNDIFKVINWNDYKNKNDKTNWHLGWNNNAKEKVYIDDLFKGDTMFFIKLKIEEQTQTNRAKLLKVYKWNSGVKSTVYEAK